MWKVKFIETAPQQQIVTELANNHENFNKEVESKLKTIVIFVLLLVILAKINEIYLILRFKYKDKEEKQR